MLIRKLILIILGTSNNQTMRDMEGIQVNRLIITVNMELHIMEVMVIIRVSLEILIFILQDIDMHHQIIDKA